MTLWFLERLLQSSLAWKEQKYISSECLTATSEMWFLSSTSQRVKNDEAVIARAIDTICDHVQVSSRRASSQHELISLQSAKESSLPRAKDTDWFSFLIVSASIFVCVEQKSAYLFAECYIDNYLECFNWTSHEQCHEMHPLRKCLTVSTHASAHANSVIICIQWAPYGRFQHFNTKAQRFISTLKLNASVKAADKGSSPTLQIIASAQHISSSLQFNASARTCSSKLQIKAVGQRFSSLLKIKAPAHRFSSLLQIKASAQHFSFTWCKQS